MITRLEDYERVILAHAPTPLEPLIALSHRFPGPALFIKRDDCTGLASGGNKTRKLEYVLKDAISQGADTIITTGGLHSNHARQTAAACAKYNLKCILVLVRPHASGTQDGGVGNLFLDGILGAEVRIIDNAMNALEEMEKVGAEIRGNGGRPHIVPLGASTPLGALGYARCAAEILSDLAAKNMRPTHVIAAGGSGGTQAGLMAGFEALGADDVSTISIDINADAPRTLRYVENLLPETRALLGLKGISRSRISVLDGYAGEAYGIATTRGNQAIVDIARTTGILLDPIYTGKAMSALLDMLDKGSFRATDCVVFIHTGGLPILFAYNRAFASIA